MGEKWIRKACKSRKKGALHRQLGVPQKQRIPKTLLEKIMRTDVGKRIRNPTKTGKGSIRVTRLLKQRANFALNAGYR